MRNDYVGLVVEKHGLLDLLVELNLTDQLLARVPHLDTAVRTGGQNKSLIVKNVHCFKGLLMLVNLVSLNSIKFLFRLLPLKKFEVPRLETEHQSVVPQLSDRMDLSEKEERLVDMHVITLEAP